MDFISPPLELIIEFVDKKAAYFKWNCFERSDSSSLSACKRSHFCVVKLDQESTTLLFESCSKKEFSALLQLIVMEIGQRHIKKISFKSADATNPLAEFQRSIQETVDNIIDAACRMLNRGVNGSFNRIQNIVSPSRLLLHNSGTLSNPHLRGLMNASCYYAFSDIVGTVALFPSLANLPSAGYWGIKSAPVPIACDLLSPFMFDARLSPALLQEMPWAQSVGLIEAGQIVRNTHWKHIHFLSQDEIDLFLQAKGAVETLVQEQAASEQLPSQRLHRLRTKLYHEPETRAALARFQASSIALGANQMAGPLNDIVCACMAETDLLPKLNYFAEQPWEVPKTSGSQSKGSENGSATTTSYQLEKINAQQGLFGVSPDYLSMMQAYRPMKMYNSVVATALRGLHEVMRPQPMAQFSAFDLLCRRSKAKLRLAMLKAESDQKLERRQAEVLLPSTKKPKKRKNIRIADLPIPGKPIDDGKEANDEDHALTGVASFRNRSKLTVYEQPLRKRIKTAVICESSDPHQRHVDQVMSSVRDAGPPSEELVAFMHEFARKKLEQMDEVQAKEAVSRGDVPKPSVLWGRFSPCAMVALAVVMEEIMRDMMQDWEDNITQQQQHLQMESNSWNNSRSSSSSSKSNHFDARKYPAGPLRFSEHALAVELELQLEGSDVLSVSPDFLQAQLEMLFGRSLDDHREQIENCLLTHQKRALDALNPQGSFENLDGVKNCTTAAEPQLGFDMRTLPPAQAAYYASAVQSRRHVGVGQGGVATMSARHGAGKRVKQYATTAELRAIRNNVRYFPPHVTDTLIAADKSKNCKSRKDAIQLQELARSLASEESDLDGDNAVEAVTEDMDGTEHGYMGYYEDND